MPFTCGSVGDVISLSILIKDLVKSLDNSRGSSAEYQAVIRELWSLDHALLEVEVLFWSCEQTVQLNALSATANECAEQCRKCITKFHEQMKRFERSLQPGGSGSFFRDTAIKVRWQVSEKEDLAKFRAEINAYCSSISMLLTTTGVTLTKLNDENLQMGLKQSDLFHKESSATQAYKLAEIKSLLEENNVLIRAASSETKDSRLSLIFDLNYFKNLGADILSFMEKIWKVNLLTYKTVISLQTSIPAQLERSWTQEPATLEDALGRVTPVHLEFLDSWEAFESVLEIRFRQLPGHRKIKQREYALRVNALDRDVEQNLAFNRCFLPGQRIDMSMIFDGGFGGVSSCPGCHLVTSQTEEEVGAQVQWCNMWYQRVVETTPTKTEFVSTIEPEVFVQDTQLPASRPQKPRWTEDGELDDNPAQFRRVRLRYWDQSHELGSSLADQDTATGSTQAAPLGILNLRTSVPSQLKYFWCQWEGCKYSSYRKNMLEQHVRRAHSSESYHNRISKFHRVDRNRFPSVDNRPLDLDGLRKVVARRGGFERVCKLNEWDDIGRDLEYAGSVALSTPLRDFYQKWLLPFEEYLKVVERKVESEHWNPETHPSELQRIVASFETQSF